MRSETRAVAVVVVWLSFVAAAGAQVAEPAKALAYRGRVVGPEGKPVIGAEVLLSVPADDLGTYKVGSSTRSGGDGTFALRDPKPQPGTTSVILARADGFGLAQAYATVDDAIELTLALAVVTRIEVFGPDGKPVPDLRLTPVSAAPRTAGLAFFATLPTELAQAMSRKTDASGVVTLDGLPAGSSVRLEVTDPRFARLDYTDNIQIGVGTDPAVKPIRLRPGGSISGTVIYGTTGKPAGGVEIVAQSLDTGGGRGWGRAVTNERGEYQMEQVAEGVYNVMFGTNTVELQNKWTAVARRDVRVGAGEHVVKQDMTLIEGVVITGKVFRGDTGAAVEGMYVGLYGPEHPRSSAMIRGARTNADGLYTLRAPPGSNYVYLSAMPPDGYRQPKPQDVDVVDEGPLTIDFALPRKPGKPVMGRVLGPDGKPAAGAAVWAEEKTAEMYARPNTKTDAKGEFRFEALTPGTLLRASGAKMLETPQTTLVNGGEADVTLRLEKRAVVALSGVVTDTDGNPIAGARVQVITLEGQYGHGMGTPEITDAKGRYRIAGLSSSGRYSVDARADGYGGSSAKITLTLGQDTAEAPALQLKAATSTIAGIVVDGAGRGVAGIGVELNGSENGYQTTKTGPDGKFSFKAVPGTRALVFLRGSDGQPYGTTDARAGGKEVRLTKAK